MGVLYDVLFKPIGRGDGSTTSAAQVTTAASDGPKTAAVADDEQAPPPEWVLDGRDDGTLVWRRRYGPPTSRTARRRVEFLDAVQVRVFERDDYSWCADSGGDAGDYAGVGGDDDGQTCCGADDEWSSYGDCVTDGTKRLRYCDQEDDYPLLVAVSVTVLGLCIGLAYMFAPVRWLLHQILVDD